MVDFEMINKIEEWDIDVEREYHIYIGDYKIYTKYKLYHEDAIELTTFSDYLGDEFEKYLKDNGIQVYDCNNSYVEEFFEQYGIEVY